MVSAYPIAETQLALALAGALLAVLADLRFRRIPNTVCLLLFAGGIALGSFELGVRGLGFSMLGAAAGFSVFFIFYWIGAMGGGDIKLMTGFGAMLGAKDSLTAAIITAMTGAMVALTVLAFARLRGRTAESIPYAPAIALGALTVLISRALGGQ